MPYQLHEKMISTLWQIFELLEQGPEINFDIYITLELYMHANIVLALQSMTDYVHSAIQQ